MKRTLPAISIIIGMVLLFCASGIAQSVITATGSPLAVNAVYGSVSISTSFSVSGLNTTEGILVTPPAGFEVSTDNINFNNTAIAGNAGNIASTLIYIRLTSLTNAGTYNGNIVLSSAGATNVNVAMPNSIVSPAPLTISARGVTKPYGTVLSNFTGTGIFDVTSGSLKNGNTINTVTIIYGTGFSGPAQVGTYSGSVVPSVVTGNNGFLITNYNVTYAPADIIILPVPLTIKAINATKVYGSALTGGPGSTAFTAVGLQNHETIGSVTVTYGTGAAAVAAVGSYTGSVNVSAPAGGDVIPANYTITYTPADIFIQPAPLTITADDKQKNFGDSNPVLTVTYSGFLNNDSPQQLTSEPVITTTAVTTSAAGTYPIRVSGAASSNYTITYIPGVLTIDVIKLVIPNTFTPNGDGINDTWKIGKIEAYPSCSVEIFNRYGLKIFSSTGYGKPWDGTCKGANVAAGTYYYIIDIKNNMALSSGSLTVVR